MLTIYLLCFSTFIPWLPLSFIIFIVVVVVVIGTDNIVQVEIYNGDVTTDNPRYRLGLSEVMYLTNNTLFLLEFTLTVSYSLLD